MFGIGPLELLVVLIVGVLSLGVPIAIIVLLVLLLRKRSSECDPTLISKLLNENQRLRNELEAANKK